MDFLSLIFRPEVMVFMIPISAIVGGVYLSSLKIKAKMLSGNLSNEEKQILIQVSNENKELKKRLANLEDIVTSLDQESLDFNRNLKKSLSSPKDGNND
jgi:hypothetical protein